MLLPLLLFSSLQPISTSPATSTATPPTTAVSDPLPTLNQIADSIRANRESLGWIRLAFTTQGRLYSGPIGSPIIERKSTGVLIKHGSHVSMSGWNEEGPSSWSKSEARFDGTRTTTRTPMAVHESGGVTPDIYVTESGFNPRLLSVDVLSNPLTCAWHEFERPLDEWIRSPMWAPPTIERIPGGSMIRLTLSPVQRPGSMLILEVDPAHAFLPSKIRLLQASPGADTLIHTRVFSDWTKLPGGAWLPRTLEFHDPDTPQDPTFVVLKITEIDETPRSDDEFNADVKGPAIFRDGMKSNRLTYIEKSGAFFTPVASSISPSDRPDLSIIVLAVATVGVCLSGAGFAIGGKRRRTDPVSPSASNPSA